MIGAAAAASKGDEDASAIFTSLVNSAFGEGAMRLEGIWRAADWRRHVLEPRRRRGHALGKRPSLRALSWAASPPLVSLVCPPRPAVAQTQDLCPFTLCSRRAVAAAPLGLRPALPSARRPAEVLERAPRCCGSGVRVCCLLYRCLGPKEIAVGFAT